MAIPAFLAVVGNFKANAIGIGEEGRPIVWRVLRVELRFRCLDPKRTKLIGNRGNICARLNTKAEVVQARSIGVMPAGIARRAQNVTEMAVEVLDVRITTQGKTVLSEAERLKQEAIVERFRTLKIRYRDVDVVDAGNFSHGSAAAYFCSSNSATRTW